MTFRQVKICLWVMAFVAAISAGINGYGLGKHDGYVEGYQLGKNVTEERLFTDDNACTIFTDDNKEIDGFCIETNQLSINGLN